VPDHSEGQFKLASFGGVTVIGEAHFNPFMKEKDQI
jgi:hypothetical protein